MSRNHVNWGVRYLLRRGQEEQYGRPENQKYSRSRSIVRQETIYADSARSPHQNLSAKLNSNQQAPDTSFFRCWDTTEQPRLKRLSEKVRTLALRMRRAPARFYRLILLISSGKRPLPAALRLPLPGR